MTIQTVGLILTTIVNVSAVIGVAVELSQHARQRRSQRSGELERLLDYGQLTVGDERVRARHVLVQLVRTEAIDSVIRRDWREKARHGWGLVFLVAAALWNLTTFTITYPSSIPAVLAPTVEMVTGPPAALHEPVTGRQTLVLYLSLVLLWISFAAAMRLVRWRQFSIGYYVYGQQRLPLSTSAICSHRWSTHPEFIARRAYVMTARSTGRTDGYLPPMLDDDFAQRFAVEYDVLVRQSHDAYRRMSTLAKVLNAVYIPPSSLRYGLAEDRRLGTTINNILRRADRRAQPERADFVERQQPLAAPDGFESVRFRQRVDEVA